MPFVTIFGGSTVFRRPHLAVLAAAALAASSFLAVPAQADEPESTAQSTVKDFPAGSTRLSGKTRYETAIAVSKRYEPGVPAVFVATGTDFPDALSAAAAAAELDSPLLLTPTESLPNSIRDEIKRLAPQRIYVVGGEKAVSANVFNALKAIGTTTRIGGADRYATSLNIVDAIFPETPHAIIATGRAFPDALAATGAAGLAEAPVILVNGTESKVSDDVISILDDLMIESIGIAGGNNAVSSAIQTNLRNEGFSVTRFGGADRYATAAAINKAYFDDDASTIFLATGQNFPDALSGAALAGALEAPMFITRTDCVPPAIHDGITATAPKSKVILGGTSAVSAGAAQNTKCVPAPKPTPTPSSSPTPTSSPKPTSSPTTKPGNPGDTKNCSDFKTQKEAQAWFDEYFPHWGDVAKLDSDGDGIACETLR